MGFIKAQEDELLLPFWEGDKEGYININGIAKIKPRFIDAEPFSEGLACVKTDAGYGYIDKTGSFAIKPSAEYSEAESFSEGLAVVKIDGKYGYINKTGKIIIPPVFTRALSFSDGLAKVVKGGTIDKWTLIGGQHGYIDKSGKIVFEHEFDSSGNFHEGRAYFRKDRKYGFIDKKGNIVIQPKYSSTWKYSEGLASVKIKIKDYDYYGYINKDGTYWIEPTLYKASPFYKGLACIKDSDGWGYMDRHKKVVLRPKILVDSAANFYGDCAMVEINQFRYLIDKTGMPVANPYCPHQVRFSSPDKLFYSITVDEKGNRIVYGPPGSGKSPLWLQKFNQEGVEKITSIEIAIFLIKMAGIANDKNKKADDISAFVHEDAVIQMENREFLTREAYARGCAENPARYEQIFKSLEVDNDKGIATVLLKCTQRPEGYSWSYMKRLVLNFLR